MDLYHRTKTSNMAVPKSAWALYTHDCAKIIFIYIYSFSRLFFAVRRLFYFILSFFFLRSIYRCCTIQFLYGLYIHLSFLARVVKIKSEHHLHQSFYSRCFTTIAKNIANKISQINRSHFINRILFAIELYNMKDTRISRNIGWTNCQIEIYSHYILYACKKLSEIIKLKTKFWSGVILAWHDVSVWFCWLT